MFTSLWLRKIKYNFFFDLIFLKIDNISFPEKVRYLINKYYAIIFNKREISLLNFGIFYDNRFTPALIQPSYKEILEYGKYIDFNKMETVLDIGGNIGLWGSLLKIKKRNLKIDSFEPNRAIAKLLMKNSENFDNWRVFNYGIDAKDGSRILYFVKDKSGEGSFIKYKFRDGLYRKQKVNTINLRKTNLKKFGLLNQYDVVKVDVEGFEEVVVREVMRIKMKYLIIEMGFPNGLTLDKLFKTLKKRYKNPKLLNKIEEQPPLWNAIIQTY